MSEMDAEQSKTAGWYAKNAVLLVLIIVVLGFIVYTFGQWQTRNEYNRIIDNEMNTQQYEAAVTSLLKLRPNVDEEMQQQIDKDLAMCYIALAEDPSRPLAESQEYLEKAEELDPSQLSEGNRRILEMKSRRPSAAPAPSSGEAASAESPAPQPEPAGAEAEGGEDQAG